MQGAAGDPKDLFLSQSLNSCCNIIQRGFFFWGGGGAEGALGHLWLWSVYPYKMLLVRDSVFWGGGMAFLSSVGTAPGTAPPRSVLRCCGFSGCGTSDIRMVAGGIGPRCRFFSWWRRNGGMKKAVCLKLVENSVRKKKYNFTYGCAESKISFLCLLQQNHQQHLW